MLKLQKLKNDKISAIDFIFLGLGIFIGVFFRNFSLFQVDYKINMVHLLNVIVTGIVVLYLNHIYISQKENHRKSKDLLMDLNNAIYKYLDLFYPYTKAKQVDVSEISDRLKYLLSSFNNLNSLIVHSKINLSENKIIFEDLKKLKTLFTDTPVFHDGTPVEVNPPLKVEESVVFINSDRVVEIESHINKLKFSLLSFCLDINNC